MKYCYLVLRKRRYVCSCGKHFFENYSFLPRYFQRTSRLTSLIESELHLTVSIKSVAQRTNVSPSTVGRILDTVAFERKRLGKALSIDEFKGNANSEKYQCFLVYPVKHKVLDIIPNRKSTHLLDYFFSIPKVERYRVNFFCCDMWQPYVDFAKSYFPNAVIVIDKYHFMRQVSWAIENIRKKLQKTMPTKLCKYYKCSHSLILHLYNTLTAENKKACDLMLLYNEDLPRAHYLKEKFFEICQNTKYSEQRTCFYSWIKSAETSGLKEFEACAKTYRY